MVEAKVGTYLKITSKDFNKLKNIVRRHYNQIGVGEGYLLVGNGDANRSWIA